MSEGRAQASGFFDWTPALSADPGTAAGTDQDDEPAELLLRHAAGLGHQHNGLPEVKPYRWRPGDAQRDTQIAEQLAAIRIRARANQPPGGTA